MCREMFGWNYPEQMGNQSCHDSEDLDVLRCYGRGVCWQKNGDGKYWCDCKLFYDPLTHCEKSFYDVYKGIDLFYPIVGFILLIPLLVLYTGELVVYINRVPHAHRSPVTWVKVIMILFCITRMVWFSLWIHRSLARRLEWDYLLSLPEGLGTVLLLATTNLVIVAWLNILIQTKTLRKNRVILRLRIIMIGVLTVCLPSILIAHILAVTGIQVRVLDSLYFTLIAVNRLIVLGIGIYGLVIIFPWIRLKVTKAPNESTAELFTSIWRKTIILAVLLVIVGLFAILSVVQSIIGIELAWNYLVFSAVGRLFEFMIMIIMFFFLENNSFKNGFIVGYINYFTHSESLHSEPQENTTEASR